MKATDLVPITSSKVCMKCLKESSEVKQYRLEERGCGSDFDNFSSIIQVCDECKPEGLETWLNEYPEYLSDGVTASYKYEGKIKGFIDTFSLEGRELFWNKYSDGACAERMDYQDYFLIATGEASDSIYDKYGLYSPKEIKAAIERFPTCANVYGIRYSNSTINYQCSFYDDVCGDIDDNTSYNNKWGDCEYFKKLVNKRPVIMADDLLLEKLFLAEESHERLRNWIFSKLRKDNI